MNRQRLKTQTLELILYIGAFLLLAEWMYTFGEVADIEYRTPLYVYALICFVVSYFKAPWWMSTPIKGISLLGALFLIDIEGERSIGSWLQTFGAEVLFNVRALFTYHWNDLTPLFRSLLILVLIWLMSYLLYYWFVMMKRVLFFIMMTVIYVSIVHTFMGYNGLIPAIRLVIISVVTLGIANVLRTYEYEAVQLPQAKRMIRFFPSLVLAIVCMIGVGLVSPVFAPQWPDPVPYIHKVRDKITGGDSGAVKKVGYGEDDTQLGGSFVQDYTPVFKATSRRSHYWRIETKDVYTGKGWRKSERESGDWKRAGTFDFDTIEGKVKTSNETATIQFEKDQMLNKLVYPYGLNSVRTKEDTVFRKDARSDSIEIARTDEKDLPTTYELSYQEPTFSVDRLKEQKRSIHSEDEYTSVPKSLPNRVKDLASEITGHYTNQYDKTKAIEQYFSQNDFHYETVDVKVPGKDEDYVDQFLFDTKAGYCDNYSTAMTVMLRTQGIPARWVKGFASGDKIGTKTDGGETKDVFEVTNANAHSWVEVYFEGSGWVPFEPTQGFTNFADFHQEVERPDRETPEFKQDEKADEDNQAQTPKKEENEEGQANPKEETNEQETSHTDEQDKANEATTISQTMIWTIVGIVLVILGAIAYFLRFRIKHYVINKQLAEDPDLRQFEEAYHFVLDYLKAKKLPLEAGETLEEFATRVDATYEGEEMRALTNAYEAMIYAGKENEEIKEQFIRSWQKVTTTIMS